MTSGGTGRLTAVVPLRDGDGKTRLAAALPGERRRHVIGALARHVVGTLLEVTQVDRVLVVTSDRGFVTQVLGTTVSPDAGDRRVLVVDQPADRPGLDAAADLGRRLAPGDRLLVIHADLPVVTAEDLGVLLAHDTQVVLATDRPGTGTNAALLAPEAHGFAFAFGPGSLRAHLREADRNGLTATVVRRPGTQTDLDTEQDWADLDRGVRERLLG